MPANKKRKGAPMSGDVAQSLAVSDKGSWYSSWQSEKQNEVIAGTSSCRDENKSSTLTDSMDTNINFEVKSKQKIEDTSFLENFLDATCNSDSCDSDMDDSDSCESDADDSDNNEDVFEDCNMDPDVGNMIWDSECLNAMVSYHYLLIIT
jgi:hypothetical protein